MKRTLLAATRALYLALVWSLASPAQRAHAAELRIDWTAPPGCSSARDLRARVTKLLNGAAQTSFQASVDVTPVAERYRAHVVLRGPSGYGERQLEDARCDLLAESVALLIALSIPSSTPPDTGLAPALALWPQMHVGFGALPSMAAGIGAAISVEGLGSIRLELRGSYFFPQSSLFEQTTLGARFQLLSAAACVCQLWSFSAVQWGPCIGAEVNHVSASGFGGAIQRPGSTTWWGPSLRMFARVQLLPVLGISIAVEGVVPLARPQFVFSDIGELHRVGAVALQVSGGPEVRF